MEIIVLLSLIFGVAAITAGAIYYLQGGRIVALTEQAENMLESQIHTLQCIAILQEQIRRLEQEVKLYTPGGKCH
jgi:hypothetical protein